MSDYAQLKQKLKALKLSGVIDTLELRIMEAQRNNLSYSEFLLMLLNDENEVRNNRRLNMLLTKARMESSKTIETFDFTFNPSINAMQIKELAQSAAILKRQRTFFS